MSLDALKHLQNRANASADDLAKRMGLKPDEFAELLDGTQRFSQLYKNALERAALGLALDKRDPSLLEPDFKWKVVRLTLLILQEHKPSVEVDGLSVPGATDASTGVEMAPTALHPRQP